MFGQLIPCCHISCTTEKFLNYTFFFLFFFFWIGVNTTDPQHSVTVQSFIHSPTSRTPTARLRSGPYPAAPTAVNPPYLLGQIGSSSPFEASICKTPPGTASSTRQDLTSPREMGGWSGPQTQAQTGDNTQPAPGTSSPPFWSWGTGQMQWRLSSLPVDAPAHPPSGMVPQILLAVSPALIRDSRTTPTFCTCSTQVLL